MTDKTSGIAYTTSIAASGAGLTLNEWVAVGGLFLAFLTFLVNAVFRYLHYRLEQRKVCDEAK